MQVDANLALVGFDAEKDFDAIVSADLFERLKPAPDIFLAAAKRVGHPIHPFHFGYKVTYYNDIATNTKIYHFYA